MELHQLYMHRCIELAKLGASQVAPNPMVGAVLVHDQTIIGEGYHRQYGQAHAEVNCLKNVAEQHRCLIADSTLYVSLEPCAHFGKTPPCADLIIERGIRKVVVGSRDPFPLVDGKGIEKLQAANVEVITGVLEQECMQLNKRFFTFHQKNRPYVILKWAESNNKIIGLSNVGRIKISNNISDRMVHKWRSEEAGILIGTNTALSDDAQLNNRLWYGNSPVRLIIDLNLRLPKHLKIFDGSQRTIIFNMLQNDTEGLTTYFMLNDRLTVCAQILEACFQLNINSILIEGGTYTLEQFIKAGLWDEARVICSESLLINGGVIAPVLYDHQLIHKEIYRNDTITYYKHNTQAD